MTTLSLDAIYADKKGRILSAPGFPAIGMSGYVYTPLTLENTIPLPEHSELFMLPGRMAYTKDRAQKYTPLPFSPIPLGVAAFIPPGYTQTLTAAYHPLPDAPLLPLFSYTAVGAFHGKLRVAAIHIDRSRRHDVRFLHKIRMQQNIHIIKKKFPHNRLIRHLARCATRYCCPNAINFFLQRQECPLPSSPSCNARCLGCISLQPAGCCPSTQQRITFNPSVNEIAEIALFHILKVRPAIVSFGQGCEGEPLLAYQTIQESLHKIRTKTRQGTLHMNTNASIPEAMETLCKAGLQSIRVSLNSVQPQYYQKYYRPRTYDFSDVCSSIKIARKYNLFVSLNYLIMPGFTDSKKEQDTLFRFLKRMDIQMIQWRNLNYDPLLYYQKLEIPHTCHGLGISTLMSSLKKEFPHLRFGYFNPFLGSKASHKNEQT